MNQSHRTLESLEKRVLSDFRRKVGRTRNSTDLSECFSQTMTRFLKEALEEPVSQEDIHFDPAVGSHYTLSRKITDSDAYRETGENTNLTHFIRGLADKSYHRYIHLEKIDSGAHNDHRHTVKR